MSLRTGVRVGIVAIFTAILSLVFVEDARSQPGRPRPGSITGMPGGVTGIPRPPSFPQPPGIPRPPTFTPPNIPSPPSFPRGPSFETVWSCGKCRAELGRGNSKPSFDSCPKCGVRFVNGGGGGNGGGFGLISPPPPADVGGGTTTPPNDPDLMPRGAAGNGGAIEPPSATSPPPSASGDSNPKPEEKPASKTGALILKIMIGVFAVLFLIGIAGGAFLIVAANKGSKPTKKARRVRDDDDE